MCKNGNVQEAYNLAKADLQSTPNDVWAQRELGWALYYMIKGAAEEGNYTKLLESIDELKSLDLLTVDNDNLIFDNVQFKVAEFVRNRLSLEDLNVSVKLSDLFNRLNDYNFNQSKGHSFLLQSYIKFEAWQGMADFIDWWDLDKLSEEDYSPYVTSNGQTIMSLAERAYIAYSKALLSLNDTERINAFLPKMDELMSQHKEMMYPGYFYGKLLLALGRNTDEALNVVIPFVRRKLTEFWVWQLLADVFVNDEEKQLACLLRAVHCRTSETFLGKVRIKLATLYIRRNQLSYAHHHIDAVTRCYATQGWRLPHQINNWIHESWFATSTPDSQDPLDYMTITNEIICEGAEEAIAVVTYVDPNSRKISMVYGKNRVVSQKLRFKVNVGDILKIKYVIDGERRIIILTAKKADLRNNLNYVKSVEGTIDKRSDKDFAFLRSESLRCFISPNIVRKNNLKNGDSVESLIVYDFNKKENSWNWVCVTVKK